MLDNGEADDKIVAVLENDKIWGDVLDILLLAKISMVAMSSILLVESIQKSLELESWKGLVKLLRPLEAPVGFACLIMAVLFCLWRFEVI